MSPVAAGLRPHVISIESPVSRQMDGDGGFVETWQTIGSARASIQTATAQATERLVIGTVASVATHIVSFPYLPGISTLSRVRFGDRVFGVVSVVTPDERHRDLVLLCAEQETIVDVPVTS